MYKYYVLALILVIYLLNYHKFQDDFVSINGIYGIKYDKSQDSINLTIFDNYIKENPGKWFEFRRYKNKKYKKKDDSVNNFNRGEITVHFKKYYVYNKEKNILINKLVLNLGSNNSNNSTENLLICKRKEDIKKNNCKVLNIYTINHYNDESNDTLTYKNENPYEIQVKSKNIIYQNYDIQNNIYNITLSYKINNRYGTKYKLDYRDKLIETDGEDDMMLCINNSDPNIIYSINDEVIQNNVTSLRNVIENSSVVLVIYNKLFNTKNFLLIQFNSLDSPKLDRKLQNKDNENNEEVKTDKENVTKKRFSNFNRFIVLFSIISIIYKLFYNVNVFNYIIVITLLHGDNVKGLVMVSYFLSLLFLIYCKLSRKGVIKNPNLDNGLRSNSLNYVESENADKVHIKLLLFCNYLILFTFTLFITRIVNKYVLLVSSLIIVYLTYNLHLSFQKNGEEFMMFQELLIQKEQRKWKRKFLNNLYLIFAETLIIVIVISTFSIVYRKFFGDGIEIKKDVKSNIGYFTDYHNIYGATLITFIKFIYKLIISINYYFKDDKKGNKIGKDSSRDSEILKIEKNNKDKKSNKEELHKYIFKDSLRYLVLWMILMLYSYYPDFYFVMILYINCCVNSKIQIFCKKKCVAISKHYLSKFFNY